MKVLLLHDDAMMLHDPGPGHPERPARLQALRRVVQEATDDGVTCAKPQAATGEQLARVHDADYIERINALNGQSFRLDADTAVSPRSVEAAYLAAGAAVSAVEAVTQNKSCSTFALVRPPGHHAERDRAMGFCLFNNIAVAAAHAIAESGCKRVLIVDWDVHHGNGTQQMFEDRCDVLYFSSHQSPLFPGSGAIDEVGVGKGAGYTVNAPLPAGLDDAAHVALYQRLLTPIADAYKPDLVLVSAGFDSHCNDPLGGMRMTENGYAALCGMARDIAQRHANGRLALILEGGYSLSALANSVKACIEVLAGKRPPVMDAPGRTEDNLISDICAAHRQRWPV